MNEWDRLERRVFPKWVYVITSADGGHRSGMTACWVTRISGTPSLMLVAINKQSRTGALIRKSSRFAINVLHADQVELARVFGLPSGRTVDKFAHVAATFGPEGVPILSDALMYLECVLKETKDWGDHTVFVGEIVGGEEFQRGDPLSYQDYENAQDRAH